MERRERKTLTGGAKKAHSLIDASSFFPERQKPKRNKWCTHITRETGRHRITTFCSFFLFLTPRSCVKRAWRMFSARGQRSQMRCCWRGITRSIKSLKNTSKPIMKDSTFSSPIFFCFVSFGRHRHCIFHRTNQEREREREEYKWKKEEEEPQSPLRKWQVINVRAIKQIGIRDIFLASLFFFFRLFPWKRRRTKDYTLCVDVVWYRGMKTEAEGASQPTNQPGTFLFQK